ncbi:MAG: PIN domain-containing protein [Pirellulaceae bacterium]|nr:PIN domain-containing protein [Pirellulaceae bacterium]
MRTVFLDTSYLIALETSSDQNHLAAETKWNAAFSQEPIQFVVTSFVFVEVATLLNSRRQHQKAVDLGNHLLQSHFAKFIPVDQDMLLAGWSYFQRHGDKTYSLTDCISFVVMQQLGIRTAFTFDHHFQQAGFEVEP